jgi:type I restriction enzyme S subunit
MQEKYKSMSNVPNLRFPEFTGKWEVKKLGEITSWSSGGTPPKDNPLFWDGDIPWISASSMRGIIYSDSELKITEAGLKKGSKLARKGTLLILVRGSMLFNKIPIGIVSKDVAFNQDVKSIVVNDYSTSEYILNWFVAFEPKILNMVTGTGIGAGKLDLLDLKALEIKIPFRHEQQKIASFFSLIHERIQAQNKIIEELKLLKATLAQKIFSQQLRFKDEGGNDFPDWKNKLGGEVFESVSNKKHSSDLPILAITQEHGAIPRDLIEYQISVTDKSVESYKVVEIGDFIISLRSFQGGIEYSKYKGICSPAYIILRNKIEINNRFYKYYLKADSYIRLLNKKLEGIRDGKMISYAYFSEINLPFPCLEEQTKIVDFLSKIDEKIEAEKQLLSQYENQKKYLLQNLFI